MDFFLIAALDVPSLIMMPNFLSNASGSALENPVVMLHPK